MMILHTMLRVGDLDRSINFYTKVLGMNLLRTTERPEQKYSLAFVGYGKGNADGQSEIELTYFNKIQQMKVVIKQLCFELGKAESTINELIFDLSETKRDLKTSENNLKQARMCSAYCLGMKTSCQNSMPIAKPIPKIL